MRSVALCTALCLGPVLFGQTNTPNITVMVDFEKPHSPVSLTAMRAELNDLMSPAGINVNLILKEDLPSVPEFSELVVFKMKGTCEMGVATPAAAPGESVAFARSYSSEGQILHFGEVECDRIRRSLEHLAGRGNSDRQQQEFGTALGIVIAHEVYHMVLGDSHHTKEGVTKARLSARDLFDAVIGLPAPIADSLHRSLAQHY